MRVDFNLKDKAGISPLLHSAVENNFQFLKYVIEELKVDPNSTNNYGETPLIYSASNSDPRILKYLI